MKTILLIILIALLIAGGGAGAYLYFNQKPQKIVTVLPEPKSMLISTPKPKPTLTPKIVEIPKSTQTSEADNLLQNYYDFYSSCLAGHFANTTTNKGLTKSPQEDCPYNQTGALTDNFALKLKPIIGYDPILCAQNLPSKILHDPTRIAGNIAKAIVHEEFPAPTRSFRIRTATASAAITIDIPVELEFQNTQWQISSITCPAPKNPL